MTLESDEFVRERKTVLKMASTLKEGSISSSHSKRNSKSLLVKMVFPFLETNSYLYAPVNRCAITNVPIVD